MYSFTPDAAKWLKVLSPTSFFDWRFGQLLPQIHNVRLHQGNDSRQLTSWLLDQQEGPTGMSKYDWA